MLLPQHNQQPKTILDNFCWCGCDRTYSYTDSFTIPIYYQNLDEEARTEDTNRLIVYPIRWGTFDPEYNVIKYAETPGNCNKCQVDLLDHEAQYSVLHYRCQFCRNSLKN